MARQTSLLWVGILLSLQSWGAELKWPTIDAAQIINQHVYSENACVPSSILNALQFGTPEMQDIYAHIAGADSKAKLQHIIAQHGSKPSVVTNGWTLYGEDRGTLSEDITPFFNALLADQSAKPVAGQFADRLKAETSAMHLRRIHRLITQSLQNGVPVVTSLRSFLAKPELQNGNTNWSGLSSHVVAISKVPETLRAHQKGFAFEYIDPASGSLQEGYVYIEDIRDYFAVKGSGASKFEWLGDKPFLLLTMPSLNLETNQQSARVRTFMTLNYIVGRF